MPGYIYVASNVALIKGLLKIGRTQNPIQRYFSLCSTHLPAPFVFEYVVLVEDPYYVEAMVHGKLADCRYWHEREFFLVSVSQAKQTIHEVAPQSVLSEFDLTSYQEKARQFQPTLTNFTRWRAP
jgi:hypothetical protein